MILVLTAGFGDGHNTAARNVAAGFQRLAPEEEARVVDLFDLAHPLAGPLMKSGCQGVITRAPWLWAWLYRRSGRISLEGRPDVLAMLRKALKKLLEDARPRAIVCTYPVYSKLLRELGPDGVAVPPLHTVITDSISIHPIWMLAPSDAYYVADEDSRRSLIALGAARELVEVTGFPVSLDFMSPPAAEEAGSGAGKILYVPSTGLRHVAKTLESLRPLLEQGVKLTIPVGKHAARLFHVLNKFEDSLPKGTIETLGWTNHMPRLLQTHDLVICKAGGAILHEALAATCPAIIDYVVPGQEEGNAELLTKHECGVVTRTPAETGEQARRLLADNRAGVRRMKANMRDLNEPDAALKIARAVLSGIQGATPAVKAALA